MSHIKGLIFDLGNTLMYLDHEWKETINQGGKDLAEFLVGQVLGIDAVQFADDFISLRESLWLRARERQVEYTADYTLATLLAQSGYEDVSQELIEEAVNVFFAFEEAHWRAYPEAIATLRQLSEEGYRLALISNATNDPLIQRLVDKGGFRKWLDVALSSAGVGVRKPHPKIFQKVLDHWDFAPSRAVMIGDTLQFDVLGAQNVGMKGVLATWDLYPNYDLGNEDIVPDATAENLSQLIEVVANFDEQAMDAEGQW
jgi:putative hydrolase of the HAD superfamily